MRPEVQVEGLDTLRKALRQIGDRDLKAALADANRKLAKAIVDKALPHVPVGRTGRLRQSVRALGNVSGALGKAGSAKVAYAAAIHWGRDEGNTNYKAGKYARGLSALQGRPFLWEAAKEVERDVVEQYADELFVVFNDVNSSLSGSMRSR